MSDALHRARLATGEAVLAERLRPAHTHWTRLRGLLGTASLPAGEGLWLKPCRRIHMFGMRYAVDAVFLDDAQRVVRVLPDLGPGRVSPPKVKLPKRSNKGKYDDTASLRGQRFVAGRY